MRGTSNTARTTHPATSDQSKAAYQPATITRKPSRSHKPAYAHPNQCNGQHYHSGDTNRANHHQQHHNGDTNRAKRCQYHTRTYTPTKANPRHGRG